MPNVWPFPPADSFIESLEFKSNYLKTYNSEQRRRLSDTARQIFSFTHPMTANQYERAKLLMYAGGNDAWYVPVWTDAQRVSASSGSNTVSIDTSSGDFRVDERVIFWVDDENYEIHVVQSISSSPQQITLYTTLDSDYTNVLCMPVRTAYCPTGLESQRTVGNVIQSDAEFTVYSGKDLSSASLYSTYRGHPIALQPQQVGTSSLRESMEREQQQFDGGINTPFFDADYSKPTQKLSAAWITYTQADLWALRKFIHSRYGMQKGFWLPTYLNGISLAFAVSSSDTELTIQAIGLDGVYESGDILIRQTDGTETALQFTSVAKPSPLNGTEILTLTGSAGVNISLSDIKSVCLLHFVRFTQNRFQLNHKNIGGRVLTRLSASCEVVPVP